MAEWRVSGAGTAAANGDYSESGTYAGKPAYQKDGGGAWLYWESSLFLVWQIYSTKEILPRWYSGAEGEEDLPANPWEIPEVMGTGAAPAPVVTAIPPGIEGADCPQTTMRVQAGAGGVIELYEEDDSDITTILFGFER